MDAYDAVIIGAGAAGLFCAATAVQRGCRVAVLDHNDQPGRKILITGGGRCNFTNRVVGPQHFLSANPHFCRSALARCPPEDIIDLVTRHGIAFHERRHGQLFCDGSAKAIVAMLLAECAGAELVFGATIGRIDHGDGFQVQSSAGTFAGRHLVVATGGLSVPTVGASGLGYRIAQQFGLALRPTEPALVPLLLPEAAACTGVAVDAVVRAGKASFQENVLFTHHGLSGPAILQASSYWQAGDAVHIDLLPGASVAALLATARAAGAQAQVGTLLSEHLPRRLLQLRIPAWAQRPAAGLANADIARIAEALHVWRIVPGGSAGYAKAEVTRGGVDTAALSSRTMAVNAVPGLHFIGEVVDVTGWLGGYNLHWAWASGRAAGEAISPV